MPLALIGLLLLAAPDSTAAPSAGLARRFVLAIGENQGDPADQTLRYAEADAHAFVDAMQQVGGVNPVDTTLLAGANADAVRSALAALGQRLATAGQPGDQLFVYISSHADEGELHLQGTHLPLRELTDYLKTAPVAVAILMVDSCRSGALTRLKGMAVAEGASVSLELPETTGRVIIASSGADEYSQESQSLGGSYFTHHFLAGLRGAADTAHDGQITLEEAYGYAYARTVESTFATRAGVQHPTYSVDLKGRGLLVLARVEEAASRLRVAVQAPGEWLLIPRRRASESYQFAKPAGPAVFAVPPGEYGVQVRSGGATAGAEVSVPTAGEITLTDADLTKESFAVASAKGSEARLTLGVAGGASSSVADGVGAEPSGGLLFRLETADHFLTILNLVVATASYAQAAGPAGSLDQQITIEGGVGRQFDFGIVSLRVALLGGGTLLDQQHTPPPSPRLDGSPFVGGFAEGAVAVGERLSLMLGGFAGPELVNDQGGLSVNARLSVELGVGWTF